MKNFKIGICQMKVKDDKADNLKRAEEMIREAHVNGSDVVVLPEMFNTPYLNDCFVKYAEDLSESKTVRMLSALTRELGIYLVGGSIPEKEKDKIFNTSFVFDDKGKIIGRHRKIHLFDIDVKDKVAFKESDTLDRGDEVTVVDTPYCKMGIAICYDMRFPELMRLMALKGAQVIIIPAQFNWITGPAHWESLIKVRALDNQVYFVAAAPALNEALGFHAYGHSMIASPWGDKMTALDEKEGIIYGEIDLDYVEKVRNELPLLKHRRIDLYDVIER